MREGASDLKSVCVQHCVCCKISVYVHCRHNSQCVLKGSRLCRHMTIKLFSSPNKKNILLESMCTKNVNIFKFCVMTKFSHSTLCVLLYSQSNPDVSILYKARHKQGIITYNRNNGPLIFGFPIGTPVTFWQGHTLAPGLLW